MTYILVLSLMASFWIVVLFLDNVFKSCMLPPYVKLLQNGVQIKPGLIQIYTTRWNRCLQKWSCKKPKLQEKWFDSGVFAACFLLPISVFVLLNAVKQMLAPIFSDQPILANENVQLIQPVLPGINIPFHDIPYYLLTLLLCSVLHEIGHALGATREDVKVQGFGFFFMGIVPGAFVDLPTEQIIFLTPWQQLRIFAAGVWHNIAIVIVAVALLLATPFLIEPFYKQGQGIQVLSVETESGLDGLNGLIPGDTLQSLNNCPVIDFSSWQQCLIDISKFEQKGYCVEKDFIHKNKQNGFNYDVKNIKSEENCCGPHSQTHLCFKNTNIISCLPARGLLESSSAVCDDRDICVGSEECLKPFLNGNNSRLVSINKEFGKTVIFVGPSEEIFKAVSVSNYISRHWLFPSRMIYIWETFLKYMIAFSGALAILNIVPCFHLDGTYILKALLDLILCNIITSSTARSRICYILTWMGTILLASVVLSGVASLIR